MAKVNFYLKDNNAEEETLVYLFFSYNGDRLKYSTGETIHPKFWNKETQRAKKTLSGSMELNNLFDRMAEETQKIFRDAITKNIVPTNEYLREKLDRKINPDKNRQKDFFEFYDEFIEARKITTARKTLQKYNALKNHLKAIQSKKRYTINFENIDLRFQDMYMNYYINDLHLLNNSIATYIKTLKAFLNWATERGYNTNLTYLKFKAKEQEADIIYLTEKELFHLYNFNFSHNLMFEEVRDIFCFGCFTGLRYSDIARTNKESVKGEELHLVSEKTTDSLIIPLNSYAKSILKKYNYSLPVISNQKANECLGLLAKEAEIDEPIILTKFRGVEEIRIKKPKYDFIGTHTARRTFVTLSLEKGMRAETVMGITGHKQYATFKRYIKITNKVKLVEMKKIWDKEPVLKVV